MGSNLRESVEENVEDRGMGDGSIREKQYR